MAQQDETTSVYMDEGILNFSPSPAKDLELLHAPLQYSWKNKKEIPTTTRTALVQADQLLRRISQQVLRIDSKRQYQKELTLNHEDQATTDTATGRPFLKRVLDSSANIFLSRNDSRQAMVYLNDAARRTQHDIQKFLVDANDPEGLLESIGSIEAQLVNGGLRYRLHALVKSALFLAVLAITLCCLLWMATQKVIVPLELKAEAKYNIEMAAYHACEQTASGTVECVEPRRPSIKPDKDNFWSQAVYSFPLVQSFSLLAIGLFSGRFLHIFMSKPAARDTFESYYKIENQLETPVSDLLADNFVALCATIIFLSGVVVIGIGSAQSSSGTEIGWISTTNIDRAEVALAFGVLIGLARQQFLGRLRNVAETSLGQSSTSS